MITIRDFSVEACLVEAGLSQMSLKSSVFRARLNRCPSVLGVMS